MSAATTTAAAIIALRNPSLAELALLLEAIESHIEHAPVGTQANDVYFYLSHARAEAEFVAEMEAA